MIKEMYVTNVFNSQNSRIQMKNGIYDLIATIKDKTQDIILWNDYINFKKVLNDS